MMQQTRNTLLTLALLAGGAIASEADVAADIDAASARADTAAIASIRDGLVADNDPGTRYLRAYAGWRLAQLLGDERGRERKSILKSARSDLNELVDEEPGNAEALALRGGVLGQLITGAFSGMTLGPKASRDLEKAIEIAPDNPRVALMRGINFHFTPGAFGGGDDKAEAELRRSRDLFDKTTTTNWPDWGELDALGWLAQVLSQQDRVEEAIVFLDEALELDPEHQWITGMRQALLARD